MIKLTLRRNSIYIIQLFIYYYLRRIDSEIIKHYFEFKDSLIFTLLMHLGEFFGGLASYIYQKTFLKNTKRTKEDIGGPILFPKKRKNMNRIDGKFKIYLLIFFAAYFDFLAYDITSFYVPKFAAISPTADLRLYSITTISSSLIFVYALKLKTGKHQFYSLLIISICLIITLIVEFIYQRQLTTFGNLFFAYALTILSLIMVTFTDTIEKYLTEFNFVNPFIILIIESIFGFILVMLNSLDKNPFIEIKNTYDNPDKNFGLLIFLLFLHFAFSAGTNVYKILSNVLYSPMAKSVCIYILNPVFIIYSYFLGNDFQINGESNVVYLIINIILSIIIGFFGFVYNEFLVLFICGLEYETHYVISKRSQTQFENAMDDLRIIRTFESDESDNNDE